MKHEKHGFPCTDDSCWCKNFQRKNAMYNKPLPPEEKEGGWDDKRAEWREKESDEDYWLAVDESGGGNWWELPEEPDMVNHPAHYEFKNFEVLDVIQEVLTHEEYVGYLRGNIIKYHLRANRKNGKQDLEKASFYTNELVDELRNDSS